MTKRTLNKKSVVVAGSELPKDERHQAFCRLYATHNDPVRASREAGFSESWIKKCRYKDLVVRYDKHIVGLMQAKEKQIGKSLALSQEAILEEMKSIAFANAQDYVKEVVDEATGTKKFVRKELHELTRAQAAAISDVKFLKNGTIVYKLPDDKAKHPYLKDLGQHLGLFHQKLIAEHRHKHMHQLSFEGVDPAKLVELERAALEVLGIEGKRLLGETIEGDYEDVTAE